MANRQECSGVVVARNGDLQVILCNTCGFHHLWPLPDAEQVKKFYEGNELWSEGWFEKERREHEAGLWNTCYRYEVDLLQSKGYRCLSLLDVGCGAGWFLLYAAGTMYWKGVALGGVEPSPKARNMAGWSIITPSLETASMPVSAIRASLVLEHVPDAIQTLQEWRSHLMDRGRLLVVVPNEMNPLQKRLGGTWWVSKFHCNYWTPSTLRATLNRCGFRVLYEGATFPIEVFPVFFGKDYRKDHELGVRCHNLRLQFEKRLGTKAFGLYHKLYQWFGWGRELIFLAERI